MGKRIAASLACIALVYGVPYAVADDEVAPSSSLPIHSPYRPQAAAPIQQPYYSQPAPQYYPPAVAPIAPAAPNYPGSFAIIANDHNTILLDTRDGKTWRLANAAGGPRWVVIEREKRINPHEEIVDSFIDPDMLKPAGSPQPAPAAVEADDPFAPPATELKKSDPFGPGEPKDPQSVIDRQSEEIRRLDEVRELRGKQIVSLSRHIENLREKVNRHAREAQEADEKWVKEVKASESFKNTINQQNEEIAKLKKRVLELEAFEPESPVPAPDEK